MANDLNLIFGNAGVASRDCRPAPACDPRPVCPACGGLECLCRPRFFAGQLLSEEDLNRLDHYIVAKNRLHNRHLFGTGVVCGLEVVCATCTPAGGSTVVVRPGYALSPCGNDIVVCRPEAVDVCDLINRCRPRHDDCLDPGRIDRDDHAGDRDEDTDDWVLAICYKEKPSRGITALRGPSCECGGKGSCGCGDGHGSSHGHGAENAEASCGCGGGGKKKATTKSATSSGARSAQCEPTLTCESYSFAAYKVPREGNERGKVDPGALIKRFICCLVPLFEQVAKFPANNATQQQLRDWLLELIDVARDYLTTEGLYDCEVAAKLNAVAVPIPGGTQQQYLANWTDATVLVLEILVAVFQKCLCAALLPPCPPAEMNDCVPIATITVGRGRCRVKHVCNISNRRFLVTGPALRYWFSWLPMAASWLPGDVTLRRLVEKFCCTPVDGRFDTLLANVRLLQNPQFEPGVLAGAGAGAGGEVAVPLGVFDPGPGKKLHPFAQLLAEAFLDERDVNPVTLLLAALGATDRENRPLVSEASLKYPGQAMLIHEIVAPALESVLPLAGAFGSGGAETARLRQSIEALERTVTAQQAVLDELRNR